MSKSTNTGLRAPAVAVGIIVVCFVVYEIWFVPKPAPPPTPAPAAPAPTAKQESAPAPTTGVVAPFADVPVAKTWPSYHGGADLCGYSDVQLPDKPSVLWQYIAEGDIRQPAVGDERGVYVATSNGAVVALDFGGKERWKKTIVRAPKDGASAPERLNAPISCVRSTVLIGSQSGTVYALDAENGETRWTYDVGGEVLGAVNFHAPADASGPVLLYVIERGAGVLQCINLENGAPVWRTDPIARTDGSMAVTNGTVVYGSCDFALHVYGAQEGRRINTIALCGDCQVASGPALVGGEIYSGSRSGLFFRADAETGAIVWTNQDSTKEIFTTPAVAGDLVVFGSEDGGVYCLERGSGKQKWRSDAKGSPSSPIIASDKVLVGVDGKLIVLKLDSGEEVWRYEVSDGIASPSIINGMVVVGSEDGTVIAFGEKSNA